MAPAGRVGTRLVAFAGEQHSTGGRTGVMVGGERRCCACARDSGRLALWLVCDVTDMEVNRDHAVRSALCVA